MFKYFIAFILTLALFGVSVRPSYATFNICNIVPWLPQCNQECIYDCNEPEPSPSPEVEATPSGQPLTEGASGCSQDCGPGDAHAPVCTTTYPKPPVNLSYEKVDGGVKIKWVPSTDGGDYQLVKYGKTQDNLEYGIPSLPATASEVDIFGMPSPFWVAVGVSRQNCTSWTETIDP